MCFIVNNSKVKRNYFNKKGQIKSSIQDKVSLLISYIISHISHSSVEEHSILAARWIRHLFLAVFGKNWCQSFVGLGQIVEQRIKAEQCCDWQSSIHSTRYQVKSDPWTGHSPFPLVKHYRAERLCVIFSCSNISFFSKIKQHFSVFDDSAKSLLYQQNTVYSLSINQHKDHFIFIFISNHHAKHLN